HFAGVGVDGELDIAAARLHAHGPDDRDGGIAHPLVFLVGERLDRRDGDGIAGVDAHRVDVFDGADDDDVIRLVAHYLELVFLPAEDGLLDEHFGDGGGVEAALNGGFEFVDVVG